MARPPRLENQPVEKWLSVKEYREKYKVPKATMSRIIHDIDFEEAILPLGEKKFSINENLLNRLLRMKWRI